MGDTDGGGVQKPSVTTCAFVGLISALGVGFVAGGIPGSPPAAARVTGRATPALSRFSGTFERMGRERDDFGRDPQREIVRSAATERAYWSWRHRMGNCEEAGAVTFTVLRQAGIPARRLQSSQGHAYTLMGVDPIDPGTWPVAYVIFVSTGALWSVEAGVAVAEALLWIWLAVLPLREAAFLTLATNGATVALSFFMKSS